MAQATILTIKISIISLLSFYFFGWNSLFYYTLLRKGKQVAGCIGFKKYYVHIGLTQQSRKSEFDSTLNGALSGVCVGNGFIRSEKSVNIHGSLDRSRGPFFNIFPFNVHPMKTLPGGTDKSVPCYEVTFVKG